MRISDALQWCTQNDNEVVGIGIGATGLIDSVKGSVVESTNLGWDDFPLLERLRSIFQHPIAFENEANASAFGEYVRGNQGSSMRNMMYVAVGDGIGCGIIINGSLYTGSLGMAGEIGHMLVDRSGQLCRCGKRGCLEVVASGSAMMKRYSTETARSDIATARDLLTAAEEGDAVARGILVRAGETIGTAIGNQINVLNLDTVILGGELLTVESILSNKIRQAALDAIIPPMRNGLDIRLSALEMNAGLIGAATLSWKQIFA